jgi:pimeloyl-ACP methyl ester carboxylesterase
MDEHTRIYYEESGQGEPVIFIHGHSLDHTMWDTQFYELEKNYRVIRYDLRGYGISSMPDENRHFLHANDLAQLMDNLEIKEAHIIGLSLGGFISTDMLALYPDRLKSVVLASGNLYPVKGPSEPMDEAEKQKRYKTIHELKEKGIDNMKREWFSGLMKSGGTQKERMRRPLWKMIAEWDAWQPLHLEPRLLLGLDAKEKLKQNPPAVPVLVLEGKSDGNHYYEHPEILDYLQNGKMQIIDDAGHMMNMEQPEKFNQAVLKFIESTKNKNIE